jgi:hypothetical protein
MVCVGGEMVCFVSVAGSSIGCSSHLACIMAWRRAAAGHAVSPISSIADVLNRRRPCSPVIGKLRTSSCCGARPLLRLRGRGSRCLHFFSWWIAPCTYLRLSTAKMVIRKEKMYLIHVARPPFLRPPASQVRADGLHIRSSSCDILVDRVNLVRCGLWTVVA